MFNRKYTPRLKKWPRDARGRLLPSGQPDELAKSNLRSPPCRRRVDPQHSRCPAVRLLKGVRQDCMCPCHDVTALADFIRTMNGRETPSPTAQPRRPMSYRDILKGASG